MRKVLGVVLATLLVFAAFVAADRLGAWYRGAYGHLFESARGE